MQLKISSLIPAAGLVLATASTVLASRHGLPLKARSHRNLARMNSDAIEKRGGGNGAPGTYYDLNMGEVACGGHYHPDDHVVAMNSPDFNNGAACGKIITINYHGKSVQATVRDECPTCGPHGVDMSEGLFTIFASTYVGEIYIDWWFGGSEPAPSPTHTKTPPPPPPSPTSTHHSKTTSSTSSSSSSSTSSTSSATPIPTPVIPGGANNIASLLQAVLRLGITTIAGGALN